VQIVEPPYQPLKVTDAVGVRTLGASLRADRCHAGLVGSEASPALPKKSLFVTAGTYKLFRLATLASSKSDGSLNANERVMT
jgi:hypothetical protein